jgi:nitrite reductase (NADH) small subunit
MSERVLICQASDLTENCGKAFPVGDRMIAVFLHAGKVYAMDDFCPHMGASLADGCLYQGSVACPWHAWRFDLKDGTWLDNPKIKTAVYTVEIVDQQVYIELPTGDE